MDNLSPTLRTQAIVLTFSIVLIFLAYHFLDRPIVFWAEAHNTHHYVILKWFTHISDVFIAIATVAYPVLAIRFHYQKQTYHDHAILAFANSIAITSFLNFNLKYIFAAIGPTPGFKTIPHCYVTGYMVSIGFMVTLRLALFRLDIPRSQLQQ